MGNFRKFTSSLTLTLVFDRVKVTAAGTMHTGLPAYPTCDSSLKQCRNMALWNLC